MRAGPPGTAPEARFVVGVQLIGRLVVGAVAAVVSFYFGADVWWSLAIGVAVVVAAILSLVRPAHRPVDWDDAGPSDATGTRREVTELSWSLTTRFGRIGRTARTRLRRLAADRLAGRGLDLRNPRDQAAIEALLGGAAYRTLTDEGRQPTRRAFVRCLDALDELATATTAAPAGSPAAPGAPPTSSTPVRIVEGQPHVR